MIDRLHQRCIKRNELGRRENEVCVREVPFVASHENSSVALCRECSTVENLVVRVGERLAFRFGGDDGASNADKLGDYGFYSVRIEVKMVSGEHFAAFRAHPIGKRDYVRAAA